MKIYKITTYSFSELSEEAQEKAIDDNRHWNTDYEWWDYICEDAKTIGALLGIDINDIYFSGFYSQGDGAMFTGNYSYKAGSTKAVKAYAPLDKDLHEIAQNLQDIQKQYFYCITASTSHSGHYYHSGCMQVNVYGDDDILGYERELPEEDITNQLRYFADWIYSQLEKEYEYLTSDEVVKESLIANEVEFNVNGSIY